MEFFDDLEQFTASLAPGDVLAYDTMTPQGGLIQFADRRNVSHVAMHVGDGMVVDATSSNLPPPNHPPPTTPPGCPPGTPPEIVKGPVRHRALCSQIPARRDEHASDTVTVNRSLLALRHRELDGKPALGAAAAAVAVRAYDQQTLSPGGEQWTFTPNDLLVLAVPVLTRSYTTAYEHAAVVQPFKKFLDGALRFVRVVFDPRRTDYTVGVTCSELVHRILTHRDVGVPLTPGADGRQPLVEYMGTTRGVLEQLATEQSGDQELAEHLLRLLDWHASADRHRQLAAADGFADAFAAAGQYDASDLVTPGDIWGFPEMVPFAAYYLPTRDGDGVPR